MTKTEQCVQAWLRGRITVAALVAVAVPSIAFARLVLFHFYVRGAFLQDSGLIAFLMWHSGVALTQPVSLGGGSFFSTHIAPLFLLFSAASWLLPLGMAQFFAVFVGLCHALLALAVLWLLVAGFGLRSGTALLMATLLAIGFAFSGLAIAIVRYPHFETLIAVCFLLFAAARVLGHPFIAATCFALGLLTREDAGFHYAILLALLIALNVANGVSLRQQRAEVGYLLVALSYAALAFGVQHIVFPGYSSFTRIYLGSPPFHHLSAALIAHRLLYQIVNRPYIVLPALATCLWALRARNPYVVLGYAACIPWTVVHLMASSALAGALASYYAFPFLIALGWPLLGVLLQRRQQKIGGGMAGSAAAFAGLLLLTFVPAGEIHDPGRLSLPEAFQGTPSWAEQAATDRAVAALSAARPSLGRLVIDDSVAALAPDDFAQAEIPLWAGPAPPDTVAFFAEGYDATQLRATAETEGLTWHYRVPDTELHLAARRNLEGVSALSGLLVRE